MLINVGLEERATLKNISGLVRLFLGWFLGNSLRKAVQTGQDVSAKMLPSSSICFRDRITAEFLGEAPAVPGCRQAILPGLSPSLAAGSTTGKSCSASATLRPKQNSNKNRREHRSQILRQADRPDLLSPCTDPSLYPDAKARAKLLCKSEPCA